MDYWIDKEKRAARAINHTKLMEQKFNTEIKKCIDESQIYTDSILCIPQQRYKTKIVVKDIDSVSAVREYALKKKTCVLNFASYKHPGGMFLNGSSAQEESLCHESFLYNVLSMMQPYYDRNQQNLNKSLYTNRAIYSPNVMFFGKDNAIYFSDVITCAAPNKKSAQDYCHISDEQNRRELISRIDFVLSAASLNQPEVLILGAFGCGVFGQNPSEVAEIFKECLNTKFKNVFDTVVFAIVDSTSINYKEFENVFAR